MKTIFLIITSAFLVFLGMGVSAQETKLPPPGLTPDSPFYFLETITEGIGTFFTFGDLKKAERYAVLAAERLAEVRAMVEKGKPELAEKTLERYEMQLNKSMARVEKAQDKGKSAEKVVEVVTRVSQATSKHLEVLAEVYEKVPDQAKPAIENAMKVSVKGHGKAVEVLKAKDALGEVPEEVSLPVQVPQEVRERVQMRAQQELQIEEALEGVDSSKSLRDICAEKGGTPEMCEQFPLEKFESFEQVESFCTERGGNPEVCTTLEDKCREFGVTEANKCFILLSVFSIKAYQSAELKAVPARPMSEQEMEERRRIEEEIRRRAEEENIETPLKTLGCDFDEIIFYYGEGCSWCQKIKDDGTIGKIEKMGIKVNQIDTAIGPIQHQFSGVPAFVIDKNIYIGYKTFEQIKKLLRCQ